MVDRFSELPPNLQNAIRLFNQRWEEYGKQIENELKNKDEEVKARVQFELQKFEASINDELLRRQRAIEDCSASYRTLQQECKRS